MGKLVGEVMGGGNGGVVREGDDMTLHSHRDVIQAVWQVS